MKIVLTPDWFLGKDVMIEFFSFIVLFIFCFLCIKNYKLNKNKKFLYLGGGFALIALAQLATILTKTALYYDTTFTQNIGQMIVTYQVVKSVDILYNIGFFFSRLLTLFGLYIIYRLPIKQKSPKDIFLAAYFILLSAIVSQQFFFLYHITAVILLVLITNNYYCIYEKNKHRNTGMLTFTFGLLALGHFIAIFSERDMFFVTSNIIELVSYIILLVLVIRILQHGKKKKQNGDNLGYIRDNPRKRRRN